MRDFFILAMFSLTAAASALAVTTFSFFHSSAIAYDNGLAATRKFSLFS
jgi:hypothetical protein